MQSITSSCAYSSKLIDLYPPQSKIRSLTPTLEDCEEIVMLHV